MSKGFLDQLLLHNESFILSLLMAENNNLKLFISFESVSQLDSCVDLGQDQLISARETHASVVSWWISYVSCS